MLYNKSSYMPSFYSQLTLFWTVRYILKRQPGEIICLSWRQPIMSFTYVNQLILQLSLFFSDFYPVIIGCNYDIWTECLFLTRFAITQDPLIQYYSSKTDDYSQNILSTLIREYKGSYHSDIQVVTHLYILFCSYMYN